ncbi:MAG: hypothetical protein HC859_10285 [Bacteroidia bacterium]|nr:hypothetical protein [Bacteroidia bacterium]
MPPGFTMIPMTVTDARPMINSTLTLGDSNNLTRTLMVDTGSTLGLLLKSTDIKSLALAGKNEPLGRGFNGYINGIVANSQRLLLETYEILNLPTGIVESEWHNHASVGMDVLKDYAFILNYVMGYACLKKQS